MKATYQDLVCWLEVSGWRHGTPGPAGARWVIEDSEPIGVFYDLNSDMPEWRPTLDRIGAVMGRSGQDIHASIVNLYTDEIVFHAKGDSSDSISLDAGVRLVEWIKSAVRTTATTSRIQKAVINGNWSASGEQIASDVRLGHTRKGSYAVPVYYRLGPPTLDAASPEVMPEMTHVESTQRRASRTLMQSLDAIERDLLRPGSEPTTTGIMEMIHKGVSKELTASLASFSKKSREVSSIETHANWASGAKAAQVESVVIPLDTGSAELLERTARTMMRMSEDSKDEFVSGPVVAIIAKDGSNARSEGAPIDTEVVVQSVRRGRSTLIHIYAKASLWEKVNKWFKTGEPVEASGEIVKIGGHFELRTTHPLRSLNQQILPF